MHIAVMLIVKEDIFEETLLITSTLSVSCAILKSSIMKI